MMIIYMKLAINLLIVGSMKGVFLLLFFKSSSKLLLSVKTKLAVVSGDVEDPGAGVMETSWKVVMVP